MSLSLPQLLIILMIIFLIFGAGKLPSVMEDVGRGLKAFKKAVKDDKEDINDKDKL